MLSQQELKPQIHKVAGYAERKITHLKELKNLFFSLDHDEGIRFEADIPGYPNKAFVFTTRCDDKICVILEERVFDKNVSAFVPGGREQWKYFETRKAAWQYVTKLLNPPIQAYYY